MQEEREGAKREMNDAVSHSRSNAGMSVCLSVLFLPDETM